MGFFKTYIDNKQNLFYEKNYLILTGSFSDDSSIQIVEDRCSIELDYNYESFKKNTYLIC